MTDIRTRALALYKPPFRFEHGYIFDSEKQMVADDGPMNGNLACRVRGWGRISYMPDAEALQDEVGKLIADALNKYYGEQT